MVSRLKVQDLGLAGVLEISLDTHRDTRGFFSEIHSPKLLEIFGVESLKQSNFSESHKDVFRGLHLQLPPFEQGKLVCCVAGAISDFVLDPNSASPTFGRVIKVELSESKRSALWVPGKYAHGFLSKQEGTKVLYFVSNPWNQDHERGINPRSTAVSDYVNLDDTLMSQKDITSYSLEEASKEIAALESRES